MGVVKHCSGHERSVANRAFEDVYKHSETGTPNGMA